MQPSDTEMEVLKVLWRNEPLSSREIHDVLADEMSWALSTTRTVVERMRAKGLLTREMSHGVAVFRSAQPKVAVLGSSLRRMLREVLGLRGKLPVSMFSGGNVLSSDELKELERIINSKDDRR
jgi:BlaI family penicillinase repressor